MADLLSWVSDKLHEILGLSDRYTAEFLVGLAKQAGSSDVLVKKLQSTGVITVNDQIQSFAVQLWERVPRKQLSEKPARVIEREALLLQRKNKSYRLLSDDEEEDQRVDKSTVKKGKVSRKRRNIRTEKASMIESDDEDDKEVSKKSRDDSDSDEWER